MVPDQGRLLQVTALGGRASVLPPAVAGRSRVESVAPLVVRDLSVSFGGVSAVSGLDLRIGEGVVVGLVGPNGCGKTTTLRAVLGLLEPQSGSVRVLGCAGGSVAARARAAWAPDEAGGLDELTVRETLRLVGALWRADEGYERRSEVLARVFRLDGRLAAAVGSLSHGQRRLVAIVAAVALARPLLVLDEATAALDPEATIVLRDVVRAAAARGAGVLVATQDLHFAESVCDRVTLLSAGRVAAEGAVGELRARFAAASLEEVFVAALGAGGRLQEVRAALDAL
jgi:ABC-type multidrug transport system ATPase subunit